MRSRKPFVASIMEPSSISEHRLSLQVFRTREWNPQWHQRPKRCHLGPLSPVSATASVTNP
jgi:hypothetical protein